MIHISLFSGIGGFELAAEWMGWRNWVSCDINEFGNKVREYYWPDGYCHKDVKTLSYETINQELSARFGSLWRDDDIILTGGFPCQPYSSAGKRLGKEDERHLWPEMLRVISEVKPTYIVGENVRGLTNWNGGVVFEEVCADLENLGYEVQPVLLPACAIGAPHRRDRIWFVAYSNNTRTNIGLRSKSQWSQNNANRGFSQFKSWQNDVDGDAADTTNCRCRRRNGEGCTYGRERVLQDECRWSQVGCQIAGCCGEWDAANSESARSERQCKYRQGQVQFNRRNSGTVPANWQDFPTQSPVCGGDDGLPTQLDGITFSKWRNESIKAYGNAIVPQVAYQIFKALCQSKFNSVTSSSDSPTTDSSTTSPSPMKSGWSNSSEQ